MKRRRWPWLVLIGAIALAAWLTPKFVTLPFIVSEGYEAFGPPISFPASKVVMDDCPAFRLDPGAPWRIEFGRGSGWHGLDTVKLDQNGRAVFHRLKRERHGDIIAHSWETTTAQLSPEAVGTLLESIEANRLLRLAKEYHADLADGTQWVLWVRQGGREKAV